MAQDRHTVAEAASLLKDPDEIAQREAENGIRQFDLALDIIRQSVKDQERPFKLRSSTILICTELRLMDFTRWRERGATRP